MSQQQMIRKREGEIERAESSAAAATIDTAATVRVQLALVEWNHELENNPRLHMKSLETEQQKSDMEMVKNAELVVVREGKDTLFLELTNAELLHAEESSAEVLKKLLEDAMKARGQLMLENNASKGKRGPCERLRAENHIVAEVDQRRENLKGEYRQVDRGMESAIIKNTQLAADLNDACEKYQAHDESRRQWCDEFTEGLDGSRTSVRLRGHYVKNI